jgi:hypothetical protein
MKKLIIFCLFIVTNTINAQVPSYVPSSGLVGYWPFNGNANDESGNGNNGVVDGATLTADRMGSIQSAYNLDGINDYITIPDSPSLRLSNATISTWISYTSTSKMMLMVKHNLLNAYNANYAFEINEYTALKGPRVLGMYDNGNCNSYNWTNYHSNTDIGDNQWHHVVGTFGTDFLKIYIDGNFIGQIATPNTAMNSCSGSELLLGRGWNGWPNWYNGKLDDLAIWNRVLTQQEITNLYNSTNTSECLTMVINTGVLSTSPVTYTSSVNIYPNPANDHITIDCGNLANVTGWSIKITNMLGQEVFNQPMNTQQYVVPLNTWTGQGMYFVKILNAQNQVVNIKKIILQ